MDPSLPTPKRVITAHDNAGKSVFHTKLDEPMSFYNATGDDNNPVGFFLAYTTSKFPTPLTTNEDLTEYSKTLADSKGSGLSKHGGVVFRCIDYPPGFVSPMHRTRSVDFGILIEGEIECVLDSGERRLLKPGDVAIQRGTMHAWANASKTNWARMYYILMDATPVVVDGKELEEDLGGIEAPASH